MNFTWISQAIDQLTTTYSGLFLAEANSWLKYIGIIILTVYALKWALVSVSGHGSYDLPGVFQFFTMFLITSLMLQYYNQPLPWTSSTVASILPDEADHLAQLINATALQTVMAKFKTAIDSIEDPPSLVQNFGACAVWVMAVAIMYLTEAVLLVVNIVGYLSLGVLILIGPIMIPWFMVPRLSWLFWNWLSAVLEFSFWRVISTAIAFAWATAWGAFMDISLHGNYTLANFATLLPVMWALNLGTIASLLYLPAKLTSDLFKGTATAGSNWVTTAAIAIRGLA